MNAGENRKPLIGLTCRWDAEKSRHYLESACSEAVAAAGGLPVLIPLLSGPAAEIAARLDGIILTGSASDVDPARYGMPRRPEVVRVHPERDETDFAVLEQAFRNRTPVLGICYGMQSLNVYLGGTLVQHIPAEVPAAAEHNSPQGYHEVEFHPGTNLAGWAGGLPQVRVNSTHHQAIARPGRGLRVAAVAPDGIIEAVEGGAPGHFLLAVQWHPERIWHTEPLSRRLFTELVEAAVAHFKSQR